MKKLLLFVAASAFAQTLPNAVPVPLPILQFQDASGNPMAGAKLCSYAAGTTTPLATYTDSTASTPNTNPTILDSGGRAQVWVGPSLYKFVLRNGGDATCSTGTVVFSADNVSDTTLYFTNYVKTVGTVSLLTFTQLGGGAMVRNAQTKMREQYSVMDFGATGDGSTDDTGAINAAITALPASGGTVYFPPSPTGSYYKVCALNIIRQNVHLTGTGSANDNNPKPSWINCPTATSPVITITAFGVEIDHLRISGNAASQLSQGIYVNNNAGFNIHDNAIDNHGGQGILVTGAGGTIQGNLLVGCLMVHARTTDAGVIQMGTDTPNVGTTDSLIFNNNVNGNMCVSQNSGTCDATPGAGHIAALYIASGSGVLRSSNNFYAFGEYGLLVRSGFTTLNKFIEDRFEFNQREGVYMATSLGGQNTFVGTHSYSNGQLANNTYNGYIFNNGSNVIAGNLCGNQGEANRIKDCILDNNAQVISVGGANYYSANQSSGQNGKLFNNASTMPISNPIVTIPVPGSQDPDPYTFTVLANKNVGIGVGQTLLRANIDSAVTTVPINSNTDFSLPGTVLIDSEQLSCTGYSGIGPVLTGCTRAAGFTTASAHTAGALVQGFSSQPKAKLEIGDSVTIAGQNPILTIKDTGTAADGQIWQFNSFSDGSSFNVLELLSCTAVLACNIAMRWDRAVATNTVTGLTIPELVAVGTTSNAYQLTMTGLIRPQILTFATLPTLGALGQSGAYTYCSDCTVHVTVPQTCTGSGGGAFAFLSSGVWKCPF